MKMVRQTEAPNHPGSQRQDPVCQRDPWPPDQHQIIEHQNLLGQKNMILLRNRCLRYLWRTWLHNRVSRLRHMISVHSNTPKQSIINK
jgi:hypothetical protein